MVDKDSGTNINSIIGRLEGGFKAMQREFDLVHKDITELRKEIKDIENHIPCNGLKDIQKAHGKLSEKVSEMKIVQTSTVLKVSIIMGGIFFGLQLLLGKVIQLI